MAQSFRVGEAPWETKPEKKELKSFKVGEAPWEQQPTWGAEEEPSKNWYDVSLNGIADAAKDNLPIIGGIIGGTAGSLLGPGGAIAGAGAGGFLGQVGKDMLAAPSALGVTQEGVSRAFSQLPNQIYQGLLSAGAEGAGQVVAKGLSAAGQKVSEFYSKTLGNLVGIDSKTAANYMANADKIEKIVKDYGKDGINEVLPEFKEGLAKSINQTRQGLSNQLGKALEGELGSKVINVSSLEDAVDSSLAKINKITKPADYNQIREFGERLSQLTDDNGNILLKDLHDFKEMLQEAAKGAYQKDGSITQSGRLAQKLAKSLGAESRSIFNEAAPELATINNKLSMIHQAESVLPKSVFSPKMTNSTLATIAMDKNPNQKEALKQIGELINDSNVIENLKNAYGATRFGDPNIFSGYQTGRSLFGGALGGAVGEVTGGHKGASQGALIGAALGSPLVAKGLLRAPGLLGPFVNPVINQASNFGSRLLIRDSLQRGQGNSVPSSRMISNPAGIPLSEVTLKPKKKAQ